jgi:hypothetical protein
MNPHLYQIVWQVAATNRLWMMTLSPFLNDRLPWVILSHPFMILPSQDSVFDSTIVGTKNTLRLNKTHQNDSKIFKDMLANCNHEANIGKPHFFSLTRTFYPRLARNDPRPCLPAGLRCSQGHCGSAVGRWQGGGTDVGVAALSSWNCFP